MRIVRLIPLLLCAALAAPLTAAPPPPPLRLVADPVIHQGVLPNGMRYLVQHNATPPGQMSIRLRIGAGSLVEQDDQRGVAHLVEHMVLNGTEHVPEGDFNKQVERLGLRIGADSNATTDYEQTVYRFDLPHNDEASLGTAFFLLREVADKATLDPAALDRERGVVLSEERTRANVNQRIGQEALGWLLSGQLITRRLPIGTTASISGVQRERLLAFYQAWYRPENATLIVVGDMDPALVVKQLTTAFGSWRGDGPAPTRPDQGRPVTRGFDQKVLSEPAMPNGLSVSWVRPAEPDPDSLARRERLIREQIAASILNQRFRRLSELGNDAPYAGARLTSRRLADTAEVTQVEVLPRLADWAKGLSVAEQELRRLTTYGVTDDEIARQLAQFRTELQTVQIARNTLPNAGLADLMLGQVNARLTPASTELQSRIFEAAVRGLTPATLNPTIQHLLSGSGPLIFLSTSRAPSDGAAALATAWTKSQAIAVTAPVREAAVQWPYDRFGTPGTVAERRVYPTLGATSVRFANGVRLIVRPNSARREQVLVRVAIGDGRRALDPAQASPEWAFGPALIGGGTTALTFDEVQRALNGKIVGLSFGGSDDSFFLTGSTRPEDLATELQLLTAYVNSPGWRRAGIDRALAAAPTLTSGLSLNPSAALSRDLEAYLRSGDQRYQLPPLWKLMTTNLSTVQDLLAPQLREGPIEVVIAGDFVPEQAIKAVAATFGSLPPRRAAAAPERDPTFPKPPAKPISVTHNGRADQAMVATVWSTIGLFKDLREARVLGVLAATLQQRLTDRLREELGSTYVTLGRQNSSQEHDGYGYLLAAAEVPADRLDEAAQNIQRIADDLARTPVSADELTRVVKPLVDSFERDRAGNEYWVQELHGLVDQPRVATMIETRSSAYAGVTAADIQQAARTYLGAGRSYRFDVVKAAPPAPPPVVTPAVPGARPVAPPAPPAPAPPRQPGG